MARLRAPLEDEGRHPLLVSTAGSKQPGDTWPDVCPGDAARAAAGGSGQLGPPRQAVSGDCPTTRGPPHRPVLGVGVGESQQMHTRAT